MLITHAGNIYVISWKVWFGDESKLGKNRYTFEGSDHIKMGTEFKYNQKTKCVYYFRISD